MVVVSFTRIAEDTKLIFGPVWDFGNSFNRSALNFIYEENPVYLTHWLKGVLQFPKFKQCVQNHWKDFYDNGLGDIDSYIDMYVEKIQVACTANQARWPAYGYDDLERRKAVFKEKLHRKIDFLNAQWTSDIEENAMDDKVISVKYIDLIGRISDRPYSGINLVVSTYSDGHTSTVKQLFK